MTVSLAEATAAARRIQAGDYPDESTRVRRISEDAVLLAGFVLAGDTERLREALETERERIGQRPSHGTERDAYNHGAAFGLSFALGALDALAGGNP